MKLSTENLVLTPDDAIDLQVHTHHSDGTWEPEALLDYLKQEKFRLVAITDHDRLDTLPQLQALAIEKQMPILAATEMTCSWREQMTDVLCYGLTSIDNKLAELAQDVSQRQLENSLLVLNNLKKQGFSFSQSEVDQVINSPGSGQPKLIFNLLEKHTDRLMNGQSAGKIMHDCGFAWQMNDIADVVEAAHQSGAVALIAHPGRTDGFVCYDEQLLDDLRADVPIDGIEVHYPRHTPSQITMFLSYARKHGLLMSAGSDSHNAENPPIAYPASLSQQLLEKVGIQFKEA